MVAVLLDPQLRYPQDKFARRREFALRDTNVDTVGEVGAGLFRSSCRRE